MRYTDKLGALLVMATGAAVLGLPGPVAAAAPVAAERTAPVAERTAFLTPAGGAVSTRSASGGARSGDFTGDGVADILARDANNGQLKVYPHSGSFNGTATYRSPVTINHGWGAIRWIGQGDITGDDLADVVYIDSGGTMRVAAHSGTFSGTTTLVAAVVIGSGWQINDLVSTGDFTGDGFDDVIARRAGTEDSYLYTNNGGLSGTSTLKAPRLMLSGVSPDVDQTLADVTGDGYVDLVFRQNDGLLGIYDFLVGERGETYSLGWGWGGINAITVTDVNVDGRPDVLGRMSSNGRLQAYRHTGRWAPTPERTAYDTLAAPVLIGTNWQANNVIT